MSTCEWPAVRSSVLLPGEHATVNGVVLGHLHHKLGEERKSKILRRGHRHIKQSDVREGVVSRFKGKGEEVHIQLMDVDVGPMALCP